MGSGVSCCLCTKEYLKVKSITYNLEEPKSTIENSGTKKLDVYNEIVDEITIPNNESNKDKKVKIILNPLNLDKTLSVVNDRVQNSDENEKEDFILDIDLPIYYKSLILEKLREEELIDNDMNEETVYDIILTFYGIRINNPGVVIYSIKDKAGIFFIVITGRLKSIDTDNNIKIIKENDCFGKSALIENGIREEKVITESETVLLCLNGNHFHALIQKYHNESNIQLKYLKKIHIFRHLFSDKLNNLYEHIKKKNYNSYIINEGEHFDKIYIIIKGIVICKKNNKICKILKDNDYFGDLNFICGIDNVSYFSYIPEENVSVYEIDYKIILDVLGNECREEIMFSIFLNAINNSFKLSEYFTNINFKNIFKIFKLSYYKEPEIIYSSDNKSKISVIICGKYKKNNIIIAKQEEIYGDVLLEMDINKLEIEILPEYECLILETSWSYITQSINCHSNNEITVFERVSKLKKIPLFANISEFKLFQLARVLIKESFNNQDIIIKEGTEGDKFFIINDGKVKITKNNKLLREMEAYSCFGEMCFAREFEVRCATVTADGSVDCYTFNYHQFKEILDEKMTAFIRKMISLQDYTIDLSGLYFLKEIGHGKFGKVFLVHNKKNFYALKSVKIRNLLNMHLLEYFVREKNIMQQLDHPFIVKFVKTLKDKKRLYFVLEYIDGLPLRNYIDKRHGKNLKNEEETKFYGSILFTAINYLHKKRIIHRDIKPENCIISPNGYLKLIDFGISKFMADSNRTNTIVGTPHYIAPEVLIGKGYSYSADYWSIGVMMFEIFYGYYPFGCNSSNVLEIYKNIKDKNVLTIPYDVKTTLISNFFKMILSKNVNFRIKTFNHVKCHPLYEDYEFDELLDLAIKPPFIPQCTMDESMIKNTYTVFNNYIKRNGGNDEDYGLYEKLSEEEENLIKEF